MPKPKLKPETEPDSRGVYWIMLAVGIWGALLASGAFLFGYDETEGAIRLAPNPVRGLIVIGCVGVFLGGWALLLRGGRKSA